MKFTITESIQIDEIKRRVQEFKNGDINATMIYLGYPSEVKSLVSKGIITPYSKEVKRALNWYNLTDLGRQEIYK